uniref:Transcription factor bHLH47-like isoform X1 n=1 Tax=Cymbidium ensifolium TaxID=78740 RepID=A0A515HG32_CYMEN|nr:transcription factor bHLH47-like isoform X1 [Cymbidium ensifolium]
MEDIRDGYAYSRKETSRNSSLSNGKSQANTSKKMHKAEREKLKRDHLNELFQELSRKLDPLGQSNCKASILADATRALRDLLAQLEKLREEHTALISESHYITLERDELKDENLALESDIGMLQNELNQRLQCSGDDTRLTPSHGDTRPASLVQRPQARYPSPSDSWPAKLLSSLPGAVQVQEQKQDSQLSCSSYSTLTSGSGGAELSTRMIQTDNNGNLG